MSNDFYLCMGRISRESKRLHIRWENLLRLVYCLIQFCFSFIFFFFSRYASLYFCCAIENQDNELLTLEIVHRYVELLDKYFGNVSVFWPFRVYPSWFLLLLISCIPFLFLKFKLSITLCQGWCWPTLVQNYSIPPYLYVLVNESLKRCGCIFVFRLQTHRRPCFRELNLIVRGLCPLFLFGFAISFLF